MRGIVASIAALMALGLAPATASSGVGSASTQAAPAIFLNHNAPLPGGTTSSPNWSGYAAFDTTFTAVHATWRQPAVTCTKDVSWSVFWVGLDGFQNGTVEQDGSSAICASGRPHYAVWWEMYPTNLIQLEFKIKPGDLIDSTVTYSPATKKYTLTVADQTSHKSFTQHEACASGLTCARSSAEWIVESPGMVGGGLYQLADFATMHFKASTTATSGHSGTISDAEWSHDAITMSQGGTVRADVSGLNTKGNAFSDTWRSS